VASKESTNLTFSEGEEAVPRRPLLSEKEGGGGKMKKKKKGPSAEEKRNKKDRQGSIGNQRGGFPLKKEESRPKSTQAERKKKRREGRRQLTPEKRSDKKNLRVDERATKSIHLLIQAFLYAGKRALPRFRPISARGREGRGKKKTEDE